MARKLFAFTHPDAHADGVGLRASTASELKLGRAEPVYVSNCSAPDRRVWLPAWYEERRLGPDGCVLAAEVLALLGVVERAHVFLESGRLPQPAFHFFCWTYVDEGESACAEDLLVLLDVSHSMAGAPVRAAKRALATFLEARRDRRGGLRELDRTGAIVFGGDGEDGVRLLCDPAAMGDEALLDLVERTTTGGCTPMALALQKGAAVLVGLEGGAGERRRRRIVLITDGFPWPRDPDALESAAGTLLEHDIAVAAVGVGEHFDREFLTSLAARTRAPFVDATRVRDLVELLEELA